MVIDGSKFFTKILSVVDWSSLLLNFSQDLPGTVFEVSATALCITYLYLKASISYNKHLPPASPAQVDFQRRQVESITFPNNIGEGMYPKSLKITN